MLTHELTRAVREGVPPKFEDEGALAQYTLDRLRARSWYLYRCHPKLDILCEGQLAACVPPGCTMGANGACAYLQAVL